MKLKRYLTGMDWAVNGMDHISRRNTGVGNISQVVLEIEGKLDLDELQKSAIRLAGKLAVLCGRVERDYNLAPCWKYPVQCGSGFPLNFKFLRVQNGKSEPEILSFLAQGLNEPFRSALEHLNFRAAIHENKSLCALTFDHRLFDAYGAEGFLNLLQQDWLSKGNLFKNIHFSEPAHLDHWKEKFLAGQKVNRVFLHLENQRPLMNLPLPQDLYKKQFRFKPIYFSEDESSKIIEAAYRSCGYLLITPYIMAITLKSLRELFTKKCKVNGDYLIPVSIDMRADAKNRQDIFFNHLSFLFYRLPDEILDDLPQAFGLIKKQLYEQIKLNIPEALCEASFLMRIAPLSALDFFTTLLLRKQGASLGFSYIGKSNYEFEQFLGNRVLNIFHMPRVPVPPGIGVFFNQFQGRINAVLSYMEGIISDEEAQVSMESLKIKLLS